MNSKDKLNVFQIFRYLFPIVFKAIPAYYILLIVLQLLSAVFLVGETFLTQNFFDVAERFDSKQSIIIAMLLFAGAYLINQILDAVTTYIRESMINKVDGILSYRIHEKASRIYPVNFEDTDKLDLINKAEMGKNHGDWLVFLFISTIFFYIPYFILMSFYLFTLKPLLSIAVLIIFIPMIVAQVMKIRVFSNLEEYIAPKRREMDCYYSYNVDRRFLKETRLLGAFNYYKNKYKEVLVELNKLVLKSESKANKRDFFVSLLSLLGYSSVLFLLFIAVMQKEISVGAFIAVFTSFTSLYFLMDNFVSFKIGYTMRNLGMIRNFISFLQMEEKQGKEVDFTSGFDIVAENVFFKYPDSNKDAVKDFSLTISNGESIAIVGENGSGKSTIARLLLGLYEPTKGSVKFNNYATNELSTDSLYKYSTAVFQNYIRYDLALKENIIISSSDKDSSDIYDVLNLTGVDINLLPNGIDTMLSRIFNGIDLSGGQWQRIAIARGLFKDHCFIVLDEPTAAIDPLEESVLYNKFLEITNSCTSIIITHRLGSVHLADKIILVKDGSILEMGTHASLIAKNGEYAKMYEAQKHWYVNIE